jgi:3-oxoadipate enol-lactonase
VLRYDTRGHGGTDAPKGPYTMELLAEDAVCLLNALGIGKAHWVGLSMGGMIGQCLALNHPDRLIRLVLCDTSATIPTEAQALWQERIDTVSEKGLQLLMEPTLERWFTPSFLSHKSGVLARVRKEFLSTSKDGYIGCIAAIRKLNYLDRLTAVRIPALILVGEEDLGTPVSAAQAIQARIKGSRLVVLPSARHLSNMEQPGPFNSALLDFLQQKGR